MPMRSFVDRAGGSWTVWSVVPHISGARVPEQLRAGWLCFAPDQGEARYRLPMNEAPNGWDVLPDQRLELLCRVAVVSASPVAALTTAEMHNSMERSDSLPVEPMDELLPVAAPHSTIG